MIGKLILAAALGAVLCAAAAPGQGYPLGPDDTLLIRSEQVKELDEKRFTVSMEGYIDLPLGGKIRVTGRRIPELCAEIETALARYYHNPRVSIEIAEYRSQPVSILGSVTNPGIYQLQGRRSLAEVLSLAGGLKPDAGYTVRISRKSGDGDAEQVISYELSSILAGGNNAAAPVYPHDVITVPRAELVYVIGDVRKPGGFGLGENENVSLLQALALAEGHLPTAALKRCTILRTVSDGKKRVSLAVNVRRLIGGKSPDVMLKANDILVIPSSTTRKVGARAAEAAIQTASGILIWRRP